LRGQIAAIESGIPRRKATGDAVRNQGRQSKQKDMSSPDDAFGKIVALANASDKSERAIRERLEHAGFEAPAIDEAVERAKSYGFIDDLRYAAVLIRSRLSQGKGIPGIERELRQQGIDILDVPGWPDDFDADREAEFDRALAFLESRPPRSKNPRESAYRKLVAKGYSSSVASSASREWCERSRLL
ncbi:MAG: regulatory protein RecX, partial [Eggerthellaceae bacterium]|nr:regulatory protein RecX [Eggerthellaceae bacterium]